MDAALEPMSASYDRREDPLGRYMSAPACCGLLLRWHCGVVQSLVAGSLAVRSGVLVW